MATGLLLQNEEGMSPGKNLRKQLAVAVTSIQWSYAIFWSISPTEPGVLVWGEGYYNGDIKTRKTIQAMELDDDLIGLQRSDQLKELYESLLAGENSNPQGGNNRRPSASLSPEDLSDTEWFYLVCMSFVFNRGQGLPGRSLANNRPIWLCNAHYADSKVFSRSLLAKSASIQTVVCFPLSGGVVELGVAEQVSEDLNLIQRVKASLLQAPNPALSGTPQLSDEILNAAIHHTPLVLGEEIHYDSPTNGSSELRPVNQPPGDGYMFVDLESINNADACQAGAQSRRVTDDQELSNGLVRASLTCGECISQAFVDHGESHPGGPTSPIPMSVNQRVPLPRERGGLHHQQDCYEVMEGEAGLEESEDSHYQSVLSSLFKSPHQSVLGPSDHEKCNNGAVSCFISWRRSGTPATGQKFTGQKLLKKILFEVPRMRSEHVLESGEDIVPRKDDYDRLREPEAGDASLYEDRIVPERKKKGKVNERFSLLKSLIPATSKVDKVSILEETISYVEELESRVRELESCRKLAEYEGTRRKRRAAAQDRAERTCENYVGGVVRGAGTKRKASSSCSIGCEGEGRKGNGRSVAVEEGSSRDRIRIGMGEKEILIEIRCPWREGLLFEIIEVVSNLSLDSHAVQSSTVEAHLCVTIKSKVRGRGLGDLSVGMVRQALRKVVDKS